MLVLLHSAGEVTEAILKSSRHPPLIPKVKRRLRKAVKDNEIFSTSNIHDDLKYTLLSRYSFVAESHVNPLVSDSLSDQRCLRMRHYHPIPK